ncbi:MAG: hypothetical protein AABX44_00680 [Nanoarchaeota archaeon]
MEESIDDKINKLTPDQKRSYHKNLQTIVEWKDYCVFYGAKDPVNLPNKDYYAIKKNLYQEMFESGKI